MSLYQQLAENLQYISPGFYKTRYFKNLHHLTAKNFSERNVEPELIWIKDFLRKDAVILDIGANVGTFLYHLESKLISKNIFAFEPNSALNKRLHRLFKNIQIFPYALSDENTTAEFKIPVIQGKKIASRGTLVTDFRELGEKENFTEQVQVKTLDDWAQTIAFSKIDFIKIDVEGNEWKTLLGGKKTILEFLPILMVEIEQRHHKNPVWDIISDIENWGYSAHFLDRKTFKITRLNEDILLRNTNAEKNKTEYINNIIFLPKNPRSV